MKRLSLLILLSALLLFQSTTLAQIKSDAVLWTLNLGVANLSNSETDSDVTGYSFNTTFEHYVKNSGFSIGLNLGFNRGEDVIVVGPNAKSYNTLSSTTLYLTGKYSFQKSSKLVPYIGLGLGWSYSNKETAIIDVVAAGDPSTLYYLETSLTGFSAAVPIGLNYFASPSVFVGLNVAPFYTENNYYKDDINWAMNFSLGFQF